MVTRVPASANGLRSTSSTHGPGFSLLRPGTPKSVYALVTFFLCYPLWWLLGLGQLGFFILTVPFAIHLLKQRRIAAPKGFALWLLFLAISVASVTTIWSSVPGLTPPGGAERLVTYGFWFAWFVTATVFLLYIGNVSEEALPTSRVIDLMAWLFLITVAGGYAGQFLWQIDFPSALEAVLPRSVARIGLVEIMIHPGLAQVQQIIGFETPRPKAPWTYANAWGANYGLLLPFFVLAFTRRSAPRSRKLLAVPLLLIAVPPVLFSLNRGLWLGLVVVSCYVALRLALQRRFLALALLTGLGILAGLLVMQTPLGDLLSARLDNPHSNEGRSNLATQAVSTVVDASPVIGLGTPREMEGNFFSAAAGATAECPKCSPPQLGTQGSMWFILFTTGLAGAVFFLGFLARRFLAGFHQRGALGIALTSVGVYLATVIWVYDVIGSSLVFVMIALALLWRAERIDETYNAQTRLEAAGHEQ